MSQSLRYLVITEKFLPRKGGSNIRFDEVYRRIGDKSTHIVTGDQPGAAEYDAAHPNTVHRVNLARRWWLLAPLTQEQRRPLHAGPPPGSPSSTSMTVIPGAVAA